MKAGDRRPGRGSGRIGWQGVNGMEPEEKEPDETGRPLAFYVD